MNPLPVTLEYDGKQYKGELSKLGGDAGTSWSLNINGLYRGTLQFSPKHGWYFHTINGRFDEWAEVLRKFVEAAHPDCSFEAEIPPPFKMFDYEYQSDEIKGLVEVHSLHGGRYYFKRKKWVVGGVDKSCDDETYFSRRQLFPEHPPMFHFTDMQFRDLIEALGAKVDDYEKDWKNNATFKLVKDKMTLAVGYVPMQ